MDRGMWGTVEQTRQEGVIKNAIKTKYPDFDELKVEDLGQIPISDFKTDDIIYWLKMNLNPRIQAMQAYHIGWIAYSPSFDTLAVAQSNGTGYERGDCDLQRDNNYVNQT
jgi:hypothetical protein